jgi:hypothetical protein
VALAEMPGGRHRKGVTPAIDPAIAQSTGNTQRPRTAQRAGTCTGKLALPPNV